MRVVRIYHAGRDATHRERDRALAAAGIAVTLIVPTVWPDADELTAEPYDVIPLDVTRPGDVNRHRYRDSRRLAEAIADLGPDLLDLHEEPFSGVAHQALGLVAPTLPVVGYTAQNIDKRFPAPFSGRERATLARLDGLYPCSRQAASVAVGKGFTGPVEVLPLPAAATFRPGAQALPDHPVRLLLVGRLVAAKGVLDAVRVAARLHRTQPVQLRIVGAGPAEESAVSLAGQLGVPLVRRPWLAAAELAAEYAAAHILLVPSRPTASWVEQFGRTVREAHVSGTVVAGYASGALPEVVGTAGVLVAPGDHDALADAVAEVLSEPARWSALRAAGVATARAETWDAVAAGMIRLYEQARQPRIHLRVRSRRQLAHDRYGPTAETAAGARPFALPVLRARTGLARPLAAAVDAIQRRPGRSVVGRPRVVFLDHAARMSGAELAMVRLIAATDIHAHVILGEHGPLEPALVDVGATVEVLPLDPAARDLRRTELGSPRGITNLAGYTRRITIRLRELGADVVHANTLKSGYYGCAAGRLAGLPSVWHLHDRIASDYLPATAVRITRMALATLPTAVIANSRATERTAGGGRARRTVLYNPYLPTLAPRTAHGELRTIGVIGRLSEWKGQDVVIRAVAALREAGLPLHLRIVGDALFGEQAYAARLRALTRTLRLGDQVVFVGHVEDVERELARLDLLVHSSRIPEPFGQVIVEGMAAGVPVIATAAGGPTEIITDGVDGVLVPPNDVDALVRAVRQLRDPGRRQALGTAGIARARDFQPARIGAQLEGLYRQLIASQPATLRPIR